MDESIVLVVVLAVISFVGSMAKKAQSKMESDKQKDAAAKRAKKAQAFGEEKTSREQVRAAGGMSSFSAASERQETMRPFGGAASQASDPSMQPMKMSTAFQGDPREARRIIPGATMDERDASERENGNRPIELQFTEDALLQGIILAEVLKRPKPGSFRQMPANR